MMGVLYLIAVVALSGLGGVCFGLALMAPRQEHPTLPPARVVRR